MYSCVGVYDLFFFPPPPSSSSRTFGSYICSDLPLVFFLSVHIPVIFQEPNIFGYH
jgi:hypothetical protein